MPSPSNGASYAAMMSGPKKRDEVSSLMQSLREDLDRNSLLPHQRNAALEQVKIYGRNVQDADPIFAPEGIETLARHGFSNSSPQTSREALRCVANALLLKPATRQVFVDKGFAENAAEKLKCDNAADDEFLASRILFLLTYDTNLNFDDLMTNNQLGDAIMQNVARHSKRYKASKKGGPIAQMEDMALSETLKLIFNLTHYYPDYNDTFSKCVPDLLKILHQAPIPIPPLQAPVNYLINALLNLDLEDQKSKNWGSSPVFPKFDQKCNVERLINILDKSIMAYPETELDQLAAPLVTLLRRIYEFAPESVKKYMQWLLLPTEDERSKPLGKSDTLSSRLLNLSTAAMCPNLRGSISAMLFELSDKDASTFVHNVGYGFASGFLLSHNIAIPENAMEAFSNQDDQHEEDGNNTDRNRAVNPITGQRYQDEEPSTEPAMTTEEKEREAERLFVLFERLKATGVVDIKNPVEDAIRSGRIQELPDDEPPSPD